MHEVIAKLRATFISFYKKEQFQTHFITNIYHIISFSVQILICLWLTTACNLWKLVEKCQKLWKNAWISRITKSANNWENLVKWSFEINSKFFDTTLPGEVLHFAIFAKKRLVVSTYLLDVGRYLLVDHGRKLKVFA